MAFRNGQPCNGDAIRARKFIDANEVFFDAKNSAYIFSLCDGTRIELIASGIHNFDQPFDGGMIMMRQLTTPICQFILDYANASRCVAIPATSEFCVLVPDPTLLSELPSGFTDDFKPLIIQSADDVAMALERPFMSWSGTRDRVLGKTTMNNKGLPSKLP